MGYGTMVYAVDFNKLDSVLDSGDDKVRKMISGRFRSDIYRLNDDFDLSNERGAPNAFEAIRHLIMGGERTLPGHIYGYSYKFVIEFFGRFLPNDCFYPCSWSHQDAEYQPQLEALGTGLSIDALNYGGPYGVRFPSPDDFPGIGHWTPEAIATGWDAMREVEDLSAEMQQVRGWLETATKANLGLVAFYH